MESAIDRSNRVAGRGAFNPREVAATASFSRPRFLASVHHCFRPSELQTAPSKKNRKLIANPCRVELTSSASEPVTYDFLIANPAIGARCAPILRTQIVGKQLENFAACSPCDCAKLMGFFPKETLVRA